MPKYMSQFKYSAESIKALVAKPQDRRAPAEKVFGAAGGRIESMYFTFGEYDGFVITEFPSDEDAASAILAVGSSGAFSDIKTTVLIPMDTSLAAMKKAHNIASRYQAPKG